MGRSEYLVVLAIFAVSVLFDFLTAVVLGTLLAMVLFIVDYSRQDIVKIALSGSDFHSQAETSDARRRLLEQHGDAILIMRLQGFLFFGSADRLKQEIERRLREKPHLRFMILDFHSIVGIDSAAVQSFRRIADTAGAADCALVLSSVAPETRRVLSRGGLVFGTDGDLVAAADLDSALAACEHSLLESVGPGQGGAPDFARQIAALLGGDADAALLAGAFERVAFSDAEPLIEEGADSREIYVIESGRARVCIGSGEHGLTIATLGPGAFVGEISFYLDRPRSASVVSDGPVVAWRLDSARLAAVEEKTPRLVARFHAAIAAMLAERLTATNRLVRFFAE